MHPDLLDFTRHWTGLAALVVFVVAYVMVISEETLRMRKSKPVMVAAGLIWILTAVAYMEVGDTHTAAQAFRIDLLDFAEVFLFVLAAMTYINTMEEVGIFHALRSWLISRRFSLRGVYWITGVIAFFVSALADNLTTALLMSTVVLSVGRSNARFTVVACINVVVAANAGGAFCPFGDITTLMVWQKGIVQFVQFFDLFLPSLVNWLVPAALMYFAVPRGIPEADGKEAPLRPGAATVVALFGVTIFLAAGGHQFLHLPPVMGMMTGLGLLKIYGYVLQRRNSALAELPDDDHVFDASPLRPIEFDVFEVLRRTEWDTLMFFYGIILSVGGLGALGYLALTSNYLYNGLGATVANVLIGALSAVIDNIPLMFAVLTMNPHMSHGEWLLITLTAGVGGSMLSIGSAAGVAVMGQARGIYTFMSHLKWSWAVALGYIASIATHLLVNADLFSR